MVRAFQADLSVLSALLLRQRNVTLFLNTISLAAGVLVVGSAIALPLAWLTSRTRMYGRRLLTLLGVLPLAIPGYVMAYALLSLGGTYGTSAQLLGFELPRLSGYWGALIAISLYTFPYLFLNLRTALLGLDSTLEEVGRSFGYEGWRLFFYIVLPQLRPAFYAGALIVTLYVLGDFGAVSLMRFETFSYALFLQYTAAYDRIYAAWIALMLLALTISFLLVEYRLLRGLRFHRSGTGSARPGTLVELGRWKFGAYVFAAVLALFALFVPVGTILFWMSQGIETALWRGLSDALVASITASAPAAILAAALALPVAYIGVRYPSFFTRSMERVAYVGYATPPLALALALVFIALHAVPQLYQTLFLLIFAYSIHFLAEAIGPLRSSLYQASPRIEEAAQSLGYGPFRAFFKATFPLLRSGLVVATAFVFLSAMKELPITFLLSPIGFETLAVNVWSYATEAMFAQAAPFALAILLFSTCFVSLLFTKERP